ncbi:Beta-lactamase precursor [Hartmannibacter diazotrophicus]|uniref:Beta-lactamase n=1 Tax=Hartmannibacter diazotrophicus TaxID=1482074 RepID=A0A2C9D2L3_9HYPH|nr:MBL fold metallo-hydrolase [Hartmannibacter diazotrophicus]SON54506.1 Beta-lactamase precursor [Hartmannibacter diazotrophicus]
MASMTETLRILNPSPGVYAYYDGRVPGKRLHSDGPNWLDDGAYSLGIASYAIVDGTEALVYDTHISLDHARLIHDHLTGLGVTSIRVVLSHWHDDHIAGNEVFADCEIIALEETAQLLQENKAKLEAEDPPIKPLVMPNRLFKGRLDLVVGSRAVELHHFEIHSPDGCVMLLPDAGLLFAGDTLEDTVTYISAPERAEIHIEELKRLAALPFRSILPNHGDEARIAAGGYGPGLIAANRDYIERLLDCRRTGAPADPSLEAFVANDLAAGDILYFEPYESVHRTNIARMLRTAA